MIKKLNEHYSFTTPASIHDEEAMTALELAGRTAAKVNETVNAFNELETETNEHLTAQDAAIKKMNDETMPAKVESEVQAHIDNGDFDEQIDKSLNNLNDRVDNLLGSVTVGSTTLDAEIIDARYGADGKTYTNLGYAVREQLNDKSSLNTTHYGVYIGSATEQYKITFKSSGSVCVVHIPTSTITFRLSGANETSYNWKDINLDLVDVPGCVVNEDGSFDIRFSYREAVVFNIKTQLLEIIKITQVEAHHCVLLINGYGNLCGGSLMKYVDVMGHQSVAPYNTGVYITPAGSDSPVTYETEGGILKLYIPGRIVFRYPGAPANGVEWVDVGADIEDNIRVGGTEAEPKGAYVTITQYGGRFVFNLSTNEYAFRTRSTPGDPNDVVLMINGYGTPAGGELMRYITNARIAEIENNVKGGFTLDDAAREKIARFAESMKDKHIKDSFIFFTDPHLTQFSGNEWRKEFDEYMQYIGAVYSEAPVNHVVCGGDWLGHGETQKEACYRLGLINSTMRKYFCHKYHNVLGNHDTNYQGKLNADSEDWTGTLSKTTLINLLYPYRETFYDDDIEGGATFGYFDTTEMRYFIFDASNDTGVLTTSEYAQAEFFVEKLNEHTSGKDVGIFIHMVKTSGLRSLQRPGLGADRYVQ